MTVEPPGPEDSLNTTGSTADTAGVFVNTPAGREPEPGSVIGRYRVLKPLGEGGMGRVYLAEQERPVRRRVALKLIRPGRDSHLMVARFNAERQALSLMQHPGIAAIFDADEAGDGQPFFAMEYVSGQPITRFADAQGMTLSERLELFSQVCDAVAHVHQQRVLHRDLTAANVLASDQDGRAVVKVIDFGIALPLPGASAKWSVTGDILGTRTSMSPEQAAGRPDLDERTDVYGLGVLLYTLLAGVRPHATGTASGEAVLCSQRLREQPPEAVAAVSACRRLSSANLIRRLERELDWIPARALRANRDHRYASVAALHDDIERYRRGLPLRSVPPRRGYRAAKFVARHRRALAAVACMCGLAGLGLGVAAWSSQQTRREASRATEAQAVADYQTQRSRREAYRSHLAAAQSALERGDLAAARRGLDRCPEALRHWEWSWLRSRARGRGRVLAHDTEVFDAVFSPDGSALLTGSRDGVARVWEVATGRLRATLRGHTHRVVSLAWSPDARRVATGSRDRSVAVWDVQSGRREAVLQGLTDSVEALAFTDAGAGVVAASPAGAHVWDLGGGPGRVLDRAPAAVWATAPDGRWIVAGRTDGRVERIDLAGGDPVWEIPERGAAVLELTVHSQGQKLLVRWADAEAAVYDTSTGRRLHVFAGLASDLTACSWDPETGGLAVGRADGSVWVRLPGESPRRLRFGGGVGVSALAWGGSGKLAVADSLGALRWLNTTSADETSADDPRVWRGHTARVNGLYFDPSGGRLVSAAADQTVRVWDQDQDQAEAAVPLDPPPEVSPELKKAFTTNRPARLTYYAVDQAGAAPETDAPSAPTANGPGALRAQAQADGRIRLTWGPAGAPVDLVGHLGPVRGLAFSPDGQTLLSHGDDATVRLWAVGPPEPHEPAASRRAVVVFRPHRRASHLVVWSPDGQQIATGHGGGATRVWEADTGRLLTTCSGGGGRVTALAFSPEGHRLGVGTQAGEVTLWDLACTERVWSGSRHVGRVAGLAFSPDTARLASTGDDRTLRLYDTADGATLLTWRLGGPPAPPVFAWTDAADAFHRRNGPHVLLSGGARPTAPVLGPEPREPAARVSWFPLGRVGSHAAHLAVEMAVRPGRRFDLLTPADGLSPGPGPDPVAADRLLDQLARVADRMDRLLGRDPTTQTAAAGRPRVVAVPRAETRVGNVALGSRGGVQAPGLLDSGLLAKAAAADRRLPVRLVDALAQNAFDLRPWFGEFRSGTVVFLRELALEDPVFAQTPPPLRPHLRAVEERYAAGDLSFLDAFTRRGQLRANAHRMPDLKPSSRRLLVAAALLRLHARYGEDAWARRFFRLLAAAPVIPGDTPAGALRQATLACAAASAAAGRDLTPEFVDRWRLPMTPAVREGFSRIDWGVAPKNFPLVWLGLQRLSPGPEQTVGE